MRHQTLYVIIIFCGVNVALIAIGLSLHRRRRRRIRKMVEARGGKVVAFGYTGVRATRTLEYHVDYIAAEGELRRVLLPRGATDLCDDQPFQLVLKEKYLQSSSQPLLRAIELAASYSKLPGYEQYKSMVRTLSVGSTESVSIAEDGANSQCKWRFAPVLQCLEAAGIASDRGSRILDLVVDGKNINLHWHVEGTSPHRILVVTRVGPSAQPDPVAESSPIS